MNNRNYTVAFLMKYLNYKSEGIGTYMKSLLLMAIMLVSLKGYGQFYPVQVQPTIKAAPVLLSDYADPTNVSIRVYLADLQKQA